MATSEQLTGVPPIVVEGVLGAVFAAGIAVTAYALADSWGGSYWMFNVAAATVLCLITLARGYHRGRAAVAGLTVAAAAMVISQAADLPAEPGPATALALSVLVGSAIRRDPAAAAVAVAAGGLALTAGVWILHGFTTVTVTNTAAWLAAVTIGGWLRALDVHRDTAAA